MATALVMDFDAISSTQVKANYTTFGEGGGVGNILTIPVDFSKSSERINKTIADAIKADALSLGATSIDAVVFQVFQSFL